MSIDIETARRVAKLARIRVDEADLPALAGELSGILRGLLDARVNVATRGGDLVIVWAGAGQPVLMTGPAVTVFEGEIEIPH